MSEQVQLLSQSVGYGILVGVGGAFAIGMIFTTKFLLKYLHENHKSTETFAVANRNVGTALTTLAVYSSWSWATELLLTLTMVYNYGIQASYFYGAGISIQIAVMALLGIHAKKKIPQAHTSLEIISLRYGKAVHIIFLFICLVNNLFACLSMIVGAAGAISIIAGNLHIVALMMLIPFSVLLYTAFGGLKATFITDFVHTLILLLVLVILNTAVLTSDLIGGINGLYDKIRAHEGDRYIDGNYQGSYLTGKSHGSIIFGLLLLFGNLGLCIMDSSFWQKTFSADQRLTVPAYLTLAVLIFSNVWPLGAIIGGASLVISKTDIWPTYPREMTDYEILSGFVLPYTLKAIVGNGGCGAILLVIYLAVTSTVLAQLISVSLIVLFDIFKRYFRPDADNKQMIWVLHVTVIIFGLFASGFSIMLHYVGTNMTWLGYFTPLLSCPGVIPMIFAITWSKQSWLAALVAPIAGLVSGIAVWCGVAYGFSGELSIESLGGQLPCLYGVMTAMILPGVVLIVISLIQNQTFDWGVFQSLELEVAPDDESDGSARYSAKHNEIEEIIEVSSQANERLLNFWIKVATFAVIFILLVTWVLWPLPLYRNWIFTKAYFNGYVTVGLIWLYSTLLIVGIWPLWVGRRLFMIVARGLIHDYRQAKSNRWKKQELPLPESLAVSSGNETLK